MTSKKISDLPLAQALTGTETVLGVQNGISVQLPASALGGGSGGGSGGGLNIDNKNPVFIFSAEPDGEISSYLNSGVIISVLDNGESLLYDGVGVSAGTYKITTVSTNITVGSFTNSGRDLQVGVHSGVDKTIDNSSIIYYIAGKRFSGSAFTTQTSQSFSKIKSYVPPALPTGNAIVTSSPVIIKQAANANTDGAYSPLTVYGTQTTGSNTINYGYITVTPNGGIESTTATNTTVAPYVLTLSNDSKVSIVHINMYNQAAVAGATLLDKQDVGVVFAIGLGGDPGANGVSTSLLTVYKTASSIPLPASGGSYNFSTMAFVAPDGWSLSSPNATIEGVYACDYTFTTSDPDLTISASTWSNVRLHSQLAPPSVSTYIATIYYKQGVGGATAAIPETPSGGSYNFSANVLTPPTGGWVISQPESTTIKTYSSDCTFTTTAPSATVNAGVWTTPIVEAQVGANGTPAKYVAIAGDHVFKFLSEKKVPEGSETITLTASLYGGLTTYEWDYWDGSAWVALSGTNNTSTYILSYNNSVWGTSTDLRIRCVSNDSIYDELNISKLYDGVSPYIVIIESTNGKEFRAGQAIFTKLIAHVFQGGIDITNSLNSSQFRWRRASIIEPNDDATWNTSYASGYKQIDVDVDAVASKATFFCDILSLT